MKKCSRCKQIKPKSVFIPEVHFHNGKADIYLGSRCPDCRKLSRKEWWIRHRNERSDISAERGFLLKLEVLYEYGEGKIACVVCGEGRTDCLSIDHIHGDGNVHRKSIGGKMGQSFYEWLRKNNFPPGYRTLCMNCQFIFKAEAQRKRRKERHSV